IRDRNVTGVQTCALPIFTVVTLLLAYPYAYLMTLATPLWRTVMILLVLIPFWTGILVRTFALVMLLRDTGVLNSTLVSAGIITKIGRAAGREGGGNQRVR